MVEITYDWKKYRAKRYSTTTKDLNITVAALLDDHKKAYLILCEYLNLIESIKNLNCPGLTKRSEIVANIPMILQNKTQGDK